MDIVKNGLIVPKFKIIHDDEPEVITSDQMDLFPPDFEEEVVETRKRLWKIPPGLLEELKRQAAAMKWRGTYAPWQWEGQDFDFRTEDLGDSVGFVYLVLHPNRQGYIGVHSYGQNTIYYKGSGRLRREYTALYGLKGEEPIGGLGMERRILHFCSDLTELNKMEKHFIAEYNAFERDDFMNLNRGGYHKFDAMRAVTAVDEWDNITTFKSEFHAATQLGEFADDEEFSVRDNQIRSYVTGKSLRYEYYLKDIYYADSTYDDLQELYAKRQEKRINAKRIPLTVVIRRCVFDLTSEMCIEVIEKRTWSTPGIAQKKLKEILGVELKDKESLVESARGITLGYRDWDGVEDIYLLEYEINGTLDELEQRRKGREQDYIDDRAKRSRVMTEKQLQTSVFCFDDERGEVTLRGSQEVSECLNTGQAHAKGILAGHTETWKHPRFNILWFEYQGTRHINDGQGFKKFKPWIFRHSDDSPDTTLYGDREVKDHFDITESTIQGWKTGRNKSWKMPKFNIASFEYNGKTYVNDGYDGKLNFFITFHHTDGSPSVTFRNARLASEYSGLKLKQIYALSKKSDKLMNFWKHPKYNISMVETKHGTLHNDGIYGRSGTLYVFHRTGGLPPTIFSGTGGMAEFFGIDESTLAGWLDGTSVSWKDPKYGITGIDITTR